MNREKRLAALGEDIYVHPLLNTKDGIALAWVEDALKRHGDPVPLVAIFRVGKEDERKSELFCIHITKPGTTERQYFEAVSDQGLRITNTYPGWEIDKPSSMSPRDHKSPAERLKELKRILVPKQEQVRRELSREAAMENIRDALTLVSSSFEKVGSDLQGGDDILVKNLTELSAKLVEANRQVQTMADRIRLVSKEHA